MICGKIILGWLDVDESNSDKLIFDKRLVTEWLVIDLDLLPNVFSCIFVFRANSEHEKGSFGSNESWEETEISERDVDHHNGSDSSEIIEEIIVEVCTSF